MWAICIFETLIIFDNILGFDNKDDDNTLVKHWEVLNSKDFLTSARTKRLSGLRNYPLSLDPVTQDKEDRDEKDGGGTFSSQSSPWGGQRQNDCDNDDISIHQPYLIV